eukprot:jgi/Chrzof1/10118/Cz04g29120.t1
MVGASDVSSVPHQHQQQQHQQQAIQPQQHQQQSHQHQHQQLGHIHVRKPGSKVHFCISCSMPIAIYGRFLPCLHAYCLTCATDMPRCYICQAHIYRVERVPQSQGLFISAATLQSFRSEADMDKHTKKVHAHLMKSPLLQSASIGARPTT